MNRLFILLIVLCFQQLHSQNDTFPVYLDENVETKFSQYGSLLENSSGNSPMIAQFNKGQKCQVIAYFGQGNFKITYKRYTGFVRAQYLKINDAMKASIEQYNDQIRLKIVKDSIQNEKEKAIELQKKYLEEKQKEVRLKYEKEKEKKFLMDSIQKVKDSINKIKFRTSCHYQMNEYDKFYDVKIVRTDNYEVNDNLKIELYRNGGKKYVFINYNGDLGCATYFTRNRSFAKIELENGAIVSVFHTWDINCGAFSLKGMLSSSASSKLKSSPIKSIRLQGTKSSAIIENIDYKTFFIDKMKCLN
jgi:hypothetical protein